MSVTVRVPAGLHTERERLHGAVRKLRDPYRPELHYMRDPGPEVPAREPSGELTIRRFQRP